jgi:hypothetical protein
MRQWCAPGALMWPSSEALANPTAGAQVRAVAVKKHGSLAAIEVEKDARADKRFSVAAEARKRGAEAEAQQEMQEARVGGGPGGSCAWGEVRKEGAFSGGEGW